MLPHFASCRAQFAADLSGCAVVNDALSPAPAWTKPARPPNFRMKGGAPPRRTLRPQLRIKALRAAGGGLAW